MRRSSPVSVGIAVLLLASACKPGGVRTSETAAAVSENSDQGGASDLESASDLGSATDLRASDLSSTCAPVCIGKTCGAANGCGGTCCAGSGCTAQTCGSCQTPSPTCAGACIAATNGTACGASAGGGPLYQPLAPGTPITNIGWTYAMGYGFTPNKTINVTHLGGYFNGTNTVYLYNRTSGAVLASATVSSANNWAYAALSSPVVLSANTPYSVAVYLPGSGGAYYQTSLPVGNPDVIVNGSCYRYASTQEPCASSGLVTSYMYGVADLKYTTSSPAAALYQPFAPGTPSTNIGWTYAMGYGFTPNKTINVTHLGGYFNGTNTVYLYNRTSGAVLASATVSSANNWAYAALSSPVALAANTPYSVAVYLPGSGGAYYSAALPVANSDVTVNGSCYRYASTQEPCASSGLVTSYMYGVADLKYAADSSGPGTCQGGVCVACAPSCAGKTCGAADGCGGTCCAGSGCTAQICGNCQSASSTCGGTCVNLPPTTVCAAATGCLQAASCTGSSPTCPVQAFQSPIYQCAAATTCQYAAYCTGSSAICPPPINLANGSACAGGTCQNGVCVACVPNCAGRNCGPNGCGGSCGSCSSGFTCSAAGVCTCTPNCAGVACGAFDGCGGTCCSGGGCQQPSCGACQSLNGCGSACVNIINGTACTNAGNFAGTCQSGACICAPSCGGKTCGSDGCGGSCGTCAAGFTCTGAGTCASCTPTTCAAQGAQCGTIPDGCGSTLACGACPAGQTCGGGGPNACGTNPCTPTTCAAQNENCGIISDGCSGTLDCGTCPAPQTCGGGGMANECGCAPALMDLCGLCGGNGSECTGCDGVMGSNQSYDACGVCGGNGSSCGGCDGVPLDACGVCGGFNACVGCDGVAHSGQVYDACGVCGGDGSSCPPPDNIVDCGASGGTTCTGGAGCYPIFASPGVPWGATAANPAGVWTLNDGIGVSQAVASAESKGYTTSTANGYPQGGCWFWSASAQGWGPGYYPDSFKCDGQCDDLIDVPDSDWYDPDCNCTCANLCTMTTTCYFPDFWVTLSPACFNQYIAAGDTTDHLQVTTFDQGTSNNEIGCEAITIDQVYRCFVVDEHARTVALMTGPSMTASNQASWTPTSQTTTFSSDPTQCLLNVPPDPTSDPDVP